MKAKEGSYTFLAKERHFIAQEKAPKPKIGRPKKVWGENLRKGNSTSEEALS